ncbi:MAG: PLP-dependent enzyme glutamate decarboxylase, partial [Actinomycetia bacterium]|nr:PLP-dependent enzyme glutamate decarboxylase [Actinomycetes bacterium]
MTPDEVLARLRANRHDDADWRSGRIFSLVYHPDDAELEELLAAVSREYLAENALNPFRFPSLARLEREAADRVAGLVHGTPGAGGLTSGGTESIFLAVYVAREEARRRDVTAPAVVTGLTAHPAFAKACHLLGVRLVRVAVGADRRVDVDALRAAVDGDTALVVASAPCYPFGVIDPVPAVAAVAAEAGTLCHVDACLGGMLLPFWERLGEPVAPWDFRVDGVTTISADLHKLGYAPKGVSVIIHRTKELRRYQTFMFDDWLGGFYGSPNMQGSRSALPMACAWAVMHHLGLEGYLRLTEATIGATRKMASGIAGVAGLDVLAP